jgi:hypothetical protein
MNRTAVKDRIFKTVILALLAVSIMVQILVSIWFYDRFKTIESRLSTYPVKEPVRVDLKGSIPELAEIDRKIDKLVQEVNGVLRRVQQSATAKRNTEAAPLPKTVIRKAKPGTAAKSTQVEVVEKIGR